MYAIQQNFDDSSAIDWARLHCTLLVYFRNRTDVGFRVCGVSVQLVEVDCKNKRRQSKCGTFS